MCLGRESCVSGTIFCRDSPVLAPSGSTKHPNGDIPVVRLASPCTANAAYFTYPLPRVMIGSSSFPVVSPTPSSITVSLGPWVARRPSTGLARSNQKLPDSLDLYGEPIRFTPFPRKQMDVACLRAIVHWTEKQLVLR